MKAVKLALAGQDRHLFFSVEAMFRIQEEFGGTGELLEALKDVGRDGFSAACRAAAIMAEQGELARRSMGYDAEPITDADAIAETMTPVEVAVLKQAVSTAVILGFGREVEAEDEEVDLYMVELNAQKKTK